MNPFTKTFVAGGAIANRRFVKFGSNDGEIVQAAAATDLIIGVSDCPGGASTGGRIDAILFGPADIDYAGSVSRGAFITSDADGKAVAAAPAEGVNNVVGGRALVAAASGDIVKSFVNIGSIQGVA